MPPFFAQVIDQLEEQDPQGEGSIGGTLQRLWFWLQFGHGWWLLCLPFALWMAIYCYRRDPQWTTWMWIILVFQPLGPLVYFIVRFLPSVDLRMPLFLQRLFSTSRIKQLDAAARQIGNAYQFEQLGEALLDVGDHRKALAAFQQALTKDPRSLPALWGVAQSAHILGDVAEARRRLDTLAEIDPTFRFGDPSLLRAKSLIALGEDLAACTLLEQHIKRWRHPEALYRLAELYINGGRPQAARPLLEGVIADLEGAPRKIVRKSFFWRGRAKRLLRQC